MENKKGFWKIILLLFIVLFISFIWELLHSGLYIYKTDTPKYLHLLSASITDMILIAFVFFLIYLKNNKNTEWIINPSKTDYISVIVAGLAISMLVEARALKLGKWAYTEAMPTILGGGITPLIQLFTTAIFSLFLIRILLKEN